MAHQDADARGQLVRQRRRLPPDGSEAQAGARNPQKLTDPKIPRADDLISEENETVQLALKRLSPKEQYDRVYRLRRAAQLSLSHTLLPKGQWTKADEDVPYILPLIKAIEAEAKEKAALDGITVIKSH
ncbi:hypothetical protein RB598_001745 [Gaeumannomyces tritici]